MKTILAQSYAMFNHTMVHNTLNDDNVEARTKFCCIEICGEQDLMHIPHYFKQDHPNVLRLLFDDVEEPLHVPLVGDTEDEREYIPVVPMTEEQGKQIYNFALANKNADVCIVHCAAGVSRSGAVASWLSEFFGISYEALKMLNRNILPNPWVLRTLRKIAKDQATDAPDGYT